MKHRRNWRDMLAGSVLTVLVLSLVTPAIASTGSRTVEIAYDNIKLVVNGEKVTPRDGSGKIVEPFTLNGTTYLPVRALGNALDMDVEWDGRTNTVYLDGRADSDDLEGAGYIGLKEARAIALKHAGLRESQVAFFQETLDLDGGKATYEIEFYSGDTEYDYEIDARSGKILDWDRDAEDFQIPGDDYISLAKAKSLAQKKAPSATLVSCGLEVDDGRAVYEGELRSGHTEYEFEIDAVSGDFLKWEVDYDD